MMFQLLASQIQSPMKKRSNRLVCRFCFSAQEILVLNILPEHSLNSLVLVLCCSAVYKSDNANGLFGLASTSRTVNEGSSTALEVVRTLGLTGMVRVSWQVSLMSSIAPASADFAPASGTIDFAAGETSKVRRNLAQCETTFVMKYTPSKCACTHYFIVSDAMPMQCLCSAYAVPMQWLCSVAGVLR